MPPGSEDTSDVEPLLPSPGGASGGSAAEPTGGALGGSAVGAGSAPAKSRGRGTAATEESPESAATEGDDGVDVDFRTLSVSIAHDLARGGGFSLVGW